MTRNVWRVCAALALFCGVMGPLMAGGARTAQKITPGTIKSIVVPPDAVYNGMTYGEWSALWWQWIFMQPAETNPILLENGTDPMKEQARPVYFLGGIWGGGGFSKATRNATIPADTALFFPVVNWVWGNGGFVGTDVPEGWGPTKLSVGFLRNGLDTNLATLDTSKMYASLDGVPISNLKDYRTASPAFDTAGPETGQNIWMLLAPQGTDWHFVDAWPTLSDGYWLMLRPLPAGQHTLKFGQPGMDITYNLTVQGSSVAK